MPGAKTVIEVEFLDDGTVVKNKTQVVMGREGPAVTAQEIIESTGTHKALRIEPETLERLRLDYHGRPLGWPE
jgi:hypothetical protein